MPTAAPTETPTAMPTVIPTSTPTDTPTAAPTATPTLPPTARTPTTAPTTESGTLAPTAAPTAMPTIECEVPKSWIKGAKLCPSADSCVSNVIYKTVEEAWYECGMVPDCDYVMRWADGTFHLRRESDPDSNFCQGDFRLYSYCVKANAFRVSDAST
jgi:hypothetical protein